MMATQGSEPAQILITYRLPVRLRVKANISPLELGITRLYLVGFVPWGRKPLCLNPTASSPVTVSPQGRA
jgi:hypothetical protein